MLLVRFERGAECGEGLIAPRQADEGDASLILYSGPRDGARRFPGCGIEGPQRFLELAALERDHGPLEGVLRQAARRERSQQAFDVEEPGHITVLHIDVVTLFPEMFAPAIGLSIVGRAQERGLVRVELHHLLDALEPGERADDRPYGGGPGMVLRAAPIARALDGILAGAPPDERRAIALTSAAGRPFRHADAERFAGLERLVLVCGHYEGVDERLTALYGAEEYSLGDFVLTGGEIPALAFLDATVRLVAGTLNPASLEAESFSAGTLDAPAYTRPPQFRGLDVPEVLLSGDHARIAAWRREQSRERTIARRPDLAASDEGEN